MDAITVLTNDHRTLETLFAEYESASTPEAKGDAVKRATRELSIHAALEEQMVYPAVRLRVDGGSGFANESIEDHQTIKRLLADLEKMQPSDAQYGEKVHALIEQVREHVAEEEGEIFPKLRSALGEQRLNQMGQLMERAKVLMPTHPHPWVPGTATAQLLAGPLASIADHLRDFVDGLRKR